MRMKLLIFLLLTAMVSTAFAASKINIPILCYHNLSALPGSMNMTPQKFESQMKWIKENGFNVISLTEAVEYLQGKRKSLPPKAIVITVDDGWHSTYKYMAPIMRKYNMPLTLFIYPQTISNGKNAMTWEELKELQQNKLFDIQSHTYSHPNFKQERKRMSAENFANFVNRELVNAKKILEEKLGKKITLLAWPFGIYDKYLEQAAAKAGYTMAFSIDARTANQDFTPMAQPRYMIIDKLTTNTFTSIIKSAKPI